MHQGMATKRIFIKSTNERSRPILRGGRARRVEGRTLDGGIVEPLNDRRYLSHRSIFMSNPPEPPCLARLYLNFEYAMIIYVNVLARCTTNPIINCVINHAKLSTISYRLSLDTNIKNT